MTDKKAKPKPKAKPKTTRKKTGPKPVIIGYDMVTRAASIQCTEYEIAKLVGLTDDGFRKRKARDKKLRDALEEGYSGGRRSLRRVQWEGAQKGNPTMMIWMGKQYLGQRDKAELKQDISVATDVRDMTDEQLEAIVRRGKK